MDFNRENDEDSEEKEEKERSLDEISRNESDKISVASSKNLNLGEQLTSQMENFYSSNKIKFMNQSKVVENTQINNEESFKAIFKFSKRQTTKLDNRLNKAELPKFKHSYLENGDERLYDLLNRKNLKNKKVRKKNLDSDSDNETLIDEETDENRLNLNEELAKQFSKHSDKLRMRTNLLQLMYRKAMQNQDASKRFAEMNSLDKLNSKKSSHRAKTSIRTKKNSLLDSTDFVSQSSIFYLTRPKTREHVPEKTNFDVSRNVNMQNNSFRLSKNEHNSNFEIFKPPTSVKSELLIKRSKTESNKLIRHHSAYVPSTSSFIVNSTLISSSSLNKSESPKGLNNFESHRPPLVSINIEQLIKNSKIMEAKCLSTFWINFKNIS